MTECIKESDERLLFALHITVLLGFALVWCEPQGLCTVTVNNRENVEESGNECIEEMEEI